MSVFSTLNQPIGRRSRYHSASTTQLYQPIPSLMVNDQPMYQANNRNLYTPQMINNRRSIYSTSSDVFQNSSNVNNDSIRRIKQPKLIKTLPRSVYSNPTMSRSINDLSTIRSSKVNRRSVLLDGGTNSADPELKNVAKTGANYHVSVDLRANLLNGNRPRPATSMQMRRNDSEQTIINRRSVIATNQNNSVSGVNSEFARTDLLLPEGNRKSVLNLTTVENIQVPPESSYPKSKATGYPSKAVINLNAPKNNTSIATQISNKENSFSLGDGYIIKSLKPSEIRQETKTQQILQNNNVDFDLCLFGTVVKQPETNVTLNSQIVDIKPTDVIQYQQTTQSRTTARAINENYDPPNAREKPKKKKVPTATLR